MTFDQVIGSDLEWRQPGMFRQFHQLIADGEEIATLDFAGVCGSRATGQWGLSQWAFQRKGFFSRYITVREAGSETDTAIFTSSWGQGDWVTFNSVVGL